MMNLCEIIPILTATAREERAARILPGSDQDLDWQRIVPNPAHRAPAPPRVENKPAPEIADQTP